MTFVYLNAADLLAKSSIASLVEAGADIRVLLMMTNNDAFDVRATAEFVGDIALDEFDGAGYSRQVIALQTLTKDAANFRVELTMSANVWNPLSASPTGRQIGGALLYIQVTDDTDSPVLSMYDDGNFPATPNGGPFTVTWSAEGAIQFRCPLS